MDYNPIRTVTPADSNGNNIGDPVTNIPTPAFKTGYLWNKEDISDETAGRVMSKRMLKKRIGRVVKLQLEWTNLSLAEGSIILKAFRHEYLNVEYLDAEEGDWITKTFYVGGIQSPLYNSKLGRWERLAFNIIQSIPDEE